MKIYTAWFAYDDFGGACSWNDTIKPRAFKTKDEMNAWIEAETNKVLAEYGISRDEFDSGNCIAVAVYWNFTEQEI